MNVLAFDFGLKHIGCALGHRQAQTIRCLPTLKADNGTIDPSQIEALVKHWGIEAFIVGLPVHMDGSASSMSDRVRGFIRFLKRHFSLEVFCVDERLSSYAARQALGIHQPTSMEKTQIDATAAAIILQQWYDEQDQPAP